MNLIKGVIEWKLGLVHDSMLMDQSTYSSPSTPPLLHLSALLPLKLTSRRRAPPINSVLLAWPVWLENKYSIHSVELRILC